MSNYDAPMVGFGRQFGTKTVLFMTPVRHLTDSLFRCKIPLLVLGNSHQGYKGVIFLNDAYIRNFFEELYKAPIAQREPFCSGASCGRGWAFEAEMLGDFAQRQS